jgi:DsbC/DsbD-like thiol-disulfide interchange protein
VPGSEAVKLEGFLSRASVEPGGRIWIGVRASIAEGFHINSWQPTLDYLIPTRVSAEAPEGFRVVAESYPAAVEHQAGGETILVYEGDAPFGVELEADPGLKPGTYVVPLTIRLQPCNESQCYPPLEARMRFNVAVTAEGGPEQHAELFAGIRSRSSSGSR